MRHKNDEVEGVGSTRTEVKEEVVVHIDDVRPPAESIVIVSESKQENRDERRKL